MKSVSLVSWAYNEEDSIEEFLQKALKLLRKTKRKFEVVIVNDGSTDRTGEILGSISKRYRQVKILTNKKNRNVGYSCRRGIRAAKNNIVFWQTIDWSYDISKLSEFLLLKEKFDVVAGVRRSPVPVQGQIGKIIATIFQVFHLKHLTKRSDTILKAIISVINYSLIRILFGLKISDYQNVVFYPRRFIQKIKVNSNSSFVNPELLLRAHYSGLSIREVPISFISRKKGKAKGTKIKSIMASILDILKNWIIFRKQRKKIKTQFGAIYRI